MLDDSFRLREADGGVNTAVIGFLVNTGNNLILLDAPVWAAWTSWAKTQDDWWTA